MGQVMGRQFTKMHMSQILLPAFCDLQHNNAFVSRQLLQLSHKLSVEAFCWTSSSCLSLMISRARFVRCATRCACVTEISCSCVVHVTCKVTCSLSPARLPLWFAAISLRCMKLKLRMKRACMKLKKTSAV